MGGDGWIAFAEPIHETRTGLLAMDLRERLDRHLLPMVYDMDAAASGVALCP